jgi:hypothetical protein
MEVGVMPKETFMDAQHGHTAKVLHPDSTEWVEEVRMDLPFMTVSWNRQGIVQVATLEGGDVDESKRRRGGYFVDVDRATVNGIIRTLRKARDQAFGADA